MGKKRVQTAGYPVSSVTFRRSQVYFTFHQENVLLTSGVNYLSCVPGVDGNRLFAEDMLPCSNSIKSVLAVQDVRCANIDNIDVGVVVDGIIRIINCRLLRRAMAGNKRGPFLCRRRSDSLDDMSRGSARSLQT